MGLITGIEPLDRRAGELREGGLYLLAGPPGTPKLVALLQFLEAGLREGLRCGLVTGAPAEDLFRQGDHWGFPLEQAWHEGRLVVVGYEGSFARRLNHAGRPAEVFEELADMLGDGLARIAVDPCSPLWETRADGVMGHGFLEWVERSGATVWGTVAGDLSERPVASTDWILQGARGVFDLRTRPDGRTELWIRKLEPPTDDEGPITLELAPSRGLVGPTGRMDRRSDDLPAEAADRLLLVALAEKLPAEIRSWAERDYEVKVVSDPLEMIERLGGPDAYGACLAYLDRQNVERAIRACRTARPHTSVPLILASDEPLRAVDRRRALDAGADDIVSGELHLGELASRIRRVRDRRLAADRNGGSDDERIGPDIVIDRPELLERIRALTRPEGAELFTLLRLAPSDAGGDLPAALLEQARVESGDLVGRDGADAVVVVLRDARPVQATAFLERVRAALGEDQASRLHIESWSSPAEADAIREWAHGA